VGLDDQATFRGEWRELFAELPFGGLHHAKRSELACELAQRVRVAVAAHDVSDRDPARCLFDREVALVREDERELSTMPAASGASDASGPTSAVN